MLDRLGTTFRVAIVVALALALALVFLVGSWEAPAVAPETSQVRSPVLTDRQLPGPSPELFDKPFYSCVRNFFVAADGDDSSLGTKEEPWRTIQRADDPARRAGDCVNVAPGTYSDGAAVTHGGERATPDGYVVYRCSRLDLCRITSGSGFVVRSAGQGPDFLVFDGFELAAREKVTYGIGFGLINAGEQVTRSSHHIWVINNVIHGFGQSGADMDSGDYIYYIHNVAYNNSNVTCDARGSGFTVVVAKATQNYTATAYDLDYGNFHVIVAWNVSHDNQVTACGSASNPYNTDGNGIIIDDFANQGTGNVLFPYETLVLGNVVYHNGGAGILVGRSSHVSVINNTAFDNSRDPFSNGTFRPEIGVGGGQYNLIIGNIAYAVPATQPNDLRCHGVNYRVPPWNMPSPCPLEWNAAFAGGSAFGIDDANNVFARNISFGGTPPYVNQHGNAMWGSDVFDCGSAARANHCDVDPKFVDAASANFTLKSDSPAIDYVEEQAKEGLIHPDAGACAKGFARCGAPPDFPP